MSWTQPICGWSTSLLLVTACATPPLPAAKSTAPEPTTERAPAQTLHPTSASNTAGTSSEPLAAAGPDHAAKTGPSELAWTLGQYAVVVDPWVKAPTEAAFGCQAGGVDKTDPVALLVIDRPARFWASVGPTFSDQLITARAVVSISPEATSAPLACGADISLDLAPGRYLVRGQRRSSSFLDDFGPAGDGFAFRVSEPGDETCPAEFATRGVHDWDGEFPFAVDYAWDLNADGRKDAHVDYQMAFMNPGTRLLMSTRYPQCLHIAADEPARARKLTTRTAGVADLELSYWELHPVETYGGRMVVTYEVKYDPRTASYLRKALRSCQEGYPDDPRTDARREQLCTQWLSEQNEHHRAYSLVDRWLQIPPARAQLSALRPDDEHATTLLRQLDDEGYRWEFGAMPTCRDRKPEHDMVFEVRLHSPSDQGEDWSRHQFVVVRQGADGQARVAAVRDDSPCPVAEVPGALEIPEFVERWLTQPWTEAQTNADPSVRARHAQLQRAGKEELLDIHDVTGCASPPDAPAWVWVASVRPAPPNEAQMPVPVFLVIERRGAGFAVTSSSDVRPLGCSPY